MNIIGWGKIIPQLAAFFVVLKRRPNHYTPFNLFLSGKPGTNKTEGIETLVQFLGHTVQVVDSSTLDDVSELAGIVDLQANRERGESKIIEGDLLKSEILVLDEFLNVRPHVAPQFRLLLQGKFVLLGKPFDMATKAIVGTGNLTEDMNVGQANVLDSPTADRFAMIVKVPSLAEMTVEEAEAILSGTNHESFALAFRKAIGGADQNYDVVGCELSTHVTKYVLSLSTQLTNTAFAFEGRRGKLLRSFVIAAIALCRAEPNRKQKDTVWAVVKDCLTYHKLSGLTLDEQVLKTAHETAYEVLKNIGIESLIAQEADLGRKVGLVIRHLTEVSPVTKADIFGKVIEATELPIKLACQQVVRTVIFANQPAELRALVERMALPFPTNGIQITPDQLIRYSQLSQLESTAFQLVCGDQEKYQTLLEKVREYLIQWGVN